MAICSLFCRLATSPSNDPWHANCHEFTVAGLHSAGGEWILRACFVRMALAQPLMTRKWREMSLGIPRSNLPSSAPELKELKGFLDKLKVVKNWDDSNWEWLQRFWNRQLEWVRLVTTGYPKWIRVEIGESFTAPQIYGHKLMEACWQTNRFSDKPKSAGWPMYSKNAKSTFLRRFFFLRGTPWKAPQTVAWACHELHTFAGFQGIIPATSYCKICLSI